MYKIYKVEENDTIDSIANKFNTTKDVLYKINGTNDIILTEGTLIIVPDNNEDIFKVYTVKKGDTIYSIASNYNISIENLLTLNGFNLDDYIYENQQILVPSEGIEVYVTKPGDTVYTAATSLNTTSENLIKENDTIYLIPDQLLYFKDKV